MSRTKFDSITKSALWSAYNNLCFYCSKPLDWDSLHIDHIIPENLLNNPSRLNQTLQELNLPAHFDINALYNLVPSHAKCNQRKGGEQFTPSTTLYYLGLVQRKLPKIEAEIEKLKTRKNKGQILSRLQVAMNTNLLSLEEVKKIIAREEESNWRSLPVELPRSVEFIDEIYNSFYLNDSYHHLYDKKLLIGGVFDHLELNHDTLPARKVSTLREWQQAINDGYYPLTTFAIKLSSVFTHLEELIHVLENARMPKISFISEPWINLSDINYLSPSIIHDFEGRLVGYTNEGMSLGQLVSKRIVKCSVNMKSAVTFQHQGFETSLTEQFRADFNKDGIEDIFVSGYTRALGGTMGYGFTSILTRYSNSHLIENIKPPNKTIPTNQPTNPQK